MTISIKTKKYLVNFSSFILCLLPLALLSGPFIPDLIISINSIIFLIMSLLEKDHIYYKTRFFYLFTVLNIYLILLSIFSINPILSFESSLFYFRFFIFSLSIWYLLNNNKKLIIYFLYSLLIAFAIAIFDGFYQFFNTHNLFGFWGPTTRMNLPFNDDLILGGYLSRMTPLLVALLLYYRLKSSNKILNNNFILCLLLIILTSLIFASTERTAIALNVISLFLFIIFLPELRKLLFVQLILAFFIIIILINFNYNLFERNFSEVFLIFSSYFYADNSNFIMLAPIHDSLYKTSINIFQDFPLFGIGPKLFRVYCLESLYYINEYSCSTHSHNIYLQMLVETGIIGFVFLIGLFILNIKKLTHIFYSQITSRKSLISDYQKCILISFFISLFPIMPSTSIFNNWMNVIYYLPVGFYLYFNNSGNHKIRLKDKE